MKKYIILVILICFASANKSEVDDYFQLSRQLVTQGDFSNALKNQKKALALSEKKFGIKSPQSAGMYNFIGFIYYSIGDFKKALEYQTKALSIREEILKKNHPDIAESYTFLGMTYQTIGEYDKSFDCRKKSLEINKKVYGKEHIKTASSYAQIGIIYNLLGDSKKSLEYLYIALSIEEKKYPNEKIDIAETCKSIGETYYTSGNYHKSLEYLNKAVVIQEKELGKKHFDLSITYTLLANTYLGIGDSIKALEYSKKSLAIVEKILGKNHTNLTTNYHIIGTVYLSMGEYSKALEYYNKGLTIKKKTLPKTHPAIATFYADIGLVYRSKKEYKKALVFYKEALAILTKQIDKKHYAITTYYNIIADLYSSIKNYPEALKYLRESIDIQEKTIGKNQSEMATSYGVMGSLYSAMGNQLEALKYFKKATDIQEKIFYKNHFFFIAYYHNIGVLYSQVGNYIESYKYAKKSFNIFIKNRDKNFILLDSKQKRNYLKSTSPVQLFFYSAFLYKQSLLNPKERKKINQYMLDSWLNYKRTVFDIENSLEILYAQTKDKDIKSKIDELNIRKRELARLYQNIPQDSKKLKQYNQDIVKIEDKISQLEIYLGSKSSKLYLKDIKYQDISKILKPNELYIDFVKVKGGYFYFSLDKFQNIKFEVFNPVQTKYIDQVVNEIRVETEKASVNIEKSKTLYTKLYDLIIRKIDIRDKTSLIISPDGLLGLIPFEAFYDKQEQKYLIEKLNIRYIPSGKELVKLYQNRNKPSDDIVVFANPSFGLNIASNSQIRRGTIDALKRTNSFFVPLSGSWAEAKNIKKLFREDSEMYMKDNANEENLFKIQAPKILHLSTHGFFIKDKDILNPMLKSGIALSGANYAIKTQTGNGIVTGFELSGINLNGTELVVLSACETGVGEVEEAEGVASLSKAFMKAGAKHIVMSLWSVDDKATATLMENFYQNIKDGKSYSVALREAKLSMIKSRKSHPYYWSAFIGSGRD